MGDVDNSGEVDQAEFLEYMLNKNNPTKLRDVRILARSHHRLTVLESKVDVIAQTTKPLEELARQLAEEMRAVQKAQQELLKTRHRTAPVIVQPSSRPTSAARRAVTALPMGTSIRPHSARRKSK